MTFPNLDWPLMKNNITRADLDAVIQHLKDPDPILTHSSQVGAFEQEWSRWLGVEHSVFVNSGASANLLTLTALRELHGSGEVIVPPLGWVSDIAAVLQAGLEPVFVDINRTTLGLDTDQVLAALTPRTRAVLLVHILGYNALTRELLAELDRRRILLIEDTCESHGATFDGRKLGTFGWASNFSFYYGHHMTTIEGGMISTSDQELYDVLRILRSHGMVREASSAQRRESYARDHADLLPDFIFAYPGYNMRPTEIGAIIGRSQLTRLDDNNRIRSRNLRLFLDQLDPGRYRTDFAVDGSCNYAFTLVLREADDALRDCVMEALRNHQVEFRRGLSGGGNQLRQPYLRRILGDPPADRFAEVDHVHFYGFYIGNYPTLDTDKINALCAILNNL